MGQNRTMPRGSFAMCESALCIQNPVPVLGNGKSLTIFLTGRDGVSLHWEPLFSLLSVVFWDGWFYCNQISNLWVCWFYSAVTLYGCCPQDWLLQFQGHGVRGCGGDGTNYAGVVACWNGPAQGLMQWIPISRCGLSKVICFPVSTYNQS